jgi:hypothetical protein
MTKEYTPYYKGIYAGVVKPSDYAPHNLTLSCPIDKLKEVIKKAEEEQKTWVNIVLYPKDSNQQQQHQPKQSKPEVDLDDEIGF